VKAIAIVSLAFAAALAAACAGPQSAHGPRPGRAAAPDESAPLPSPRETRLTPPGERPTLETLPGMKSGDLNSLLGAPQFRHRDGQAEIWQYRGAACTLDVFLYQDGSDLRVRYVEARQPGSAKDASGSPEARACAGDLLDARASGAS
jgi:hypothetical protein